MELNIELIRLKLISKINKMIIAMSAFFAGLSLGAFLSVNDDGAKKYVIYWGFVTMFFIGITIISIIK